MTESFVGRRVDTARRVLTARFDSHGIESPELDARLLIGAVLKLDLTGLIVAAARTLTPAEARGLADFAERRIAGEPVSRIIGVKEFWGLPLKLSADTLVPRPDTETVVEAGLQSLGDAGDSPLIADLGTGSGAILLALLSERPMAFGIGTDISEAALRTARRNAQDLGVAGRAGFVACNYADALSGGFDLIVSNPPYIPVAEIADLAVEVRDHDPARALDGGADGLDAYRALIPAAAERLAPGGALVVEIGQGQSDAVQALMRAVGLVLAGPPKPDLGGVPRAVSGRRLPP